MGSRLCVPLIGGRRWTGSSTPLPLAPAPQVETKTRHEIEQKKQQLRGVVGDSYRQAWEPAAAFGCAFGCHRRGSLVGSPAAHPAASPTHLAQGPNLQRRHHHRHRQLVPPPGGPGRQPAGASARSSAPLASCCTSRSAQSCGQHPPSIKPLAGRRGSASWQAAWRRGRRPRAALPPPRPPPRPTTACMRWAAASST